MARQLPAGDLFITQQPSGQNVALGRYIASLEHGGPFAESGQFAVLVEASAPELYKESALLAIRQTGEDERSEYLIAGIGGDGALIEEVTGRYFLLEQQIENLPRSSVLITPENYKFQFRGEVNTGNGRAYVYDIAPKKRSFALFKGQIWIDAITGGELLVSGRLRDVPSVSKSISFVRETKVDESGYTRVTHLSFAIPLLGRSELIVTERRLRSRYDLPTLQSSPGDGFNLPGFQGGLSVPAVAQ